VFSSSVRQVEFFGDLADGPRGLAPLLTSGLELEDIGEAHMAVVAAR
jgi:hypothetical protein